MAGLRHRLVVCLTALSFASFLALPPAVRADDDPPVPHACECNITGSISVCQGAQDVAYTTVTTGINNATYLWSQVSGPAVSFDTPTLSSTNVDFSAPGVVRIRCLITDDGTGGCEDCTPILDITVHPALVVDAGPDQSICETSTVPLSGTSNGTNCVWTTGGDGTFNVGQTVYTPGSADISNGTVTLTYTCDAIAPCTGTAFDLMVVTINANPSCLITALTPCEDTIGNVASVPAAFGPATYNWSVTGNGFLVGGQNTPSITYTTTGPGIVTISVTITDGHSPACICSNSVNLNVLPKPDATITHNANGDLCPNWAGYVASVPAIPPCGVGGPATYSWSISAGGTIVGSATLPSVSFKVGTPGPTSVTLSVTVTGCNGCVKTNSVVFNVCNTGTCQSGQLRLAGPTGCFDTTAPNNTFSVQLHMDNISCPAAGYQAFIGYDSTKLQYVGGSYTPSPFGQTNIPINTTIGSLNHPNLGQIDLSRGISLFVPPIQVPASGSAHLATITFNVISDTGCDGVYVFFRPDPAGPGDGPRPPTRMTDLAGFGFGTIATPQSVAGLGTVNAASIRIDGTGPVATAGSIAACYPTVAAAQAAALAASSALDNCPGVLTPTATPVPDTGCDWNIFVDYVDSCGNTSNFLTYSTKIDNTPPVITCPANTAIQCSDSILPLNTGTATALDACPGAVTISYGDAITANGGNFVTMPSPAGWGFYTQNSGTGNLVAGPSTPPAGTGSFEMRTGTGDGAGLGGKTWLFTNNHTGTSLSSITTLKYSTYRSAHSGLPGASNLLPALNMYVDWDNNGTRDTTLVFEPIYVPGQGAPADNTWQEWDCLTAENGWWYTSNFGVLTNGGGGEFRPLSYYIGLYPNAKIVIWAGQPSFNVVTGMNSGGFWKNWVGAVDNVKFNASTYDFEAGALEFHCGASIARTWTAVDGCGNSSSCVQSIQVSDTTGPVITCPPNVTIECSDSTDPNLVGTANVNGFNVDPVLSPTQAAGTWYTDRYAPFGFVRASFLGNDRLKHSINAADCETCRPGGFNSAFYNTQGRKYDISGTTQMSIQLYVPSAWATTGRRMAGFWGTGFDSLAAVASFPIIEFTSSSDGSGLPRFRGWDSAGAWIDMGLPAGFVYDAWYTLKIELVGANWRYTVGNLQLVTSAFGAVEIENVILQGHNNLAGVTYDIYWDNFSTTVPQPATAVDNCDPAPVITYTDVPLLAGCDGTGTIQRTWHAEDACGNETTCLQTITVVDTTAPVITCAANVVVNPTAADLLDCDADDVNIVAPTASDNCDATVTVVGIRSDTLAVVTPGLNSFPPGVTSITWTATDDCNNASICVQTVTVNAVSIAVNVELSPTIDFLPVQRCITFQVFSCPVTTPQTITKVLNFTDQGGDAIANDTLCVPVSSITCVTARDTLHTLRSRVEAGDGLLGVGPTYTANFVGKRAGEPGLPIGSGHRLVGGNLNDDEYIDILDFGTWAGEYLAAYPGAPNPGDTTCSTTAPHADITGDGTADSGDFTFIGINFLMFREANCCGLLNAEPGANDPAGDRPRSRPVTRISVQDLHARGMATATAGDINHDGWVDMNDVMLAWFGLAPPTQPAPVDQPVQNPNTAPVTDQNPGASRTAPRVRTEAIQEVVP